MDFTFDRTKNIESLILIWLDLENIFNNDLGKTMRAIIDYCKLCQDVKECDAFLKMMHRSRRSNRESLYVFIRWK